MPVLVGFVFPALHLVYQAWLRLDFAGFSPRLVGEALARCSAPPPVWVQSSSLAVFGDGGDGAGGDDTRGWGPPFLKGRDGDDTADQTRSYWCGPTSMQMIVWGWRGRQQSQDHWADRLNTTSSGTSRR